MTTDTTSGIPTAKGYLPIGTPTRDCVDHNRACKVTRIATAALTAGYTETITDDQMDAIADTAGVRRPGGTETREAVRAALLPSFDRDNTAEDLHEAVLDAVERGLPFRFHDTKTERTFLLVALPVEE